MENIQMFNVGIARLSELSGRGEAMWAGAEPGSGSPRCGAPGPADPRAAPEAFVIYRSAAALGEIAWQLGGEGTGTFPRCVPPSGRPCPAGAARSRERCPGLSRSSAVRIGLRAPAGPGLLRRSLGDTSACDSGKFCSGRAAGRAARSAGLGRFPALGQRGISAQCAGGGCSRIPAGQSEP